MEKVCNQCGNEYQLIGGHWSQSSDCSHPSFTQHQKEIIIGLLMGDGWIDRHGNKNPYLKCEMVSENYLQHIDKNFGVFGNGVSMRMTAAESAEKVRERVDLGQTLTLLIIPTCTDGSRFAIQSYRNLQTGTLLVKRCGLKVSSLPRLC